MRSGHPPLAPSPLQGGVEGTPPTARAVSGSPSVALPPASSRASTAPWESVAAAARTPPSNRPAPLLEPGSASPLVLPIQGLVFRKGSCRSAHRRPCRYQPRARRTTIYRRNLTTIRTKVLARRSGPIWFSQVVLPLALASVAASECGPTMLSNGKGASSRQARERMSRYAGSVALL